MATTTSCHLFGLTTAATARFWRSGHKRHETTHSIAKGCIRCGQRRGRTQSCQRRPTAAGWRDREGCTDFRLQFTLHGIQLGIQESNCLPLVLHICHQLLEFRVGDQRLDRLPDRLAVQRQKAFSALNELLTQDVDDVDAEQSHTCLSRNHSASSRNLGREL